MLRRCFIVRLSGSAALWALAALAQVSPPQEFEIYQHAAVFVRKILNGANPADVPIEQPTRFALAINLRTARLLGLTLSPALLARADEVIE